MGIAYSITSGSASEALAEIRNCRPSSTSEDDHSKDIGMMFAVLFEEGIKPVHTTSTLQAFKTLTGSNTLEVFLEDEERFRSLAQIVAYFYADAHTMLDHFDPEMYQRLVESPVIAEDIIQFASFGRVNHLSEITPELLAEALKVEAPLRSGVL